MSTRAGCVRWLRRLALGAVALVLFAWGVTCVAAWAMQDALIFHPRTFSLAQMEERATRFGATPFTLHAEDGTRLHGMHAAGDGERAILFFHGNGGGVSAVPWIRDQLDGVDVYGISYRGYPGSEGRPSEAGFVLDARALWSYVIEEQGYAPEDVVLMGQSMGGGVMHHLLMEAEPAGAVFDSTFLSLEQIAHDTLPFVPVSLLLAHPFRSVDRAPSVTVPTLVLHGRDDHLIPVWHGRRLAELQPRSTYVEIPNHGHDAWTLDRPEARNPWYGFLQRVWGVDVRPAPE